MGDAYSYYETIDRGEPTEYLKLYYNGKVIEEERTIYLEGLDMPLTIHKIVEVRVGGTSLRFVTKDGRYYIVSRDKIIFCDIIPKENVGVIL